MKNPIHPGQLVKTSLDNLGVTVTDAAKGIGVDRQILYNIIAGRTRVSPEMAIRFEKAFSGKADTWLKMQVNYDLAQMRKRASSIVVERLSSKVA